MPLRLWPKCGKRTRNASERTPRRTGRLNQHTLMCNLGRVLDISAGGMRILCKKVPRSRVSVQLVGHPLPAKLTAVKQWSKRRGMFEHEVGLKFEDVTPAVAKCLSEIACGCRLRAAA